MTTTASKPHESYVFAQIASSKDEGSCNGCNLWTDGNGSIEHVVTIIHGRSISMRFCANCLARLRFLISPNNE